MKFRLNIKCLLSFMASHVAVYVKGLQKSEYVATLKTLHYRGVKSRHNYDEEEFMKRLKLRQLLLSERNQMNNQMIR